MYANMTSRIRRASGPTGVLEPSSVPAGQLSVPISQLSILLLAFFPSGVFSSFHGPLANMLCRARGRHGTPGGLNATPWRLLGAPFHASRRPFAHFSRLFGLLERFQNVMIFFHRSKWQTSQPKRATSQPKVDFGTKLPGYLEPFYIIFSIFS